MTNYVWRPIWFVIDYNATIISLLRAWITRSVWQSLYVGPFTVTSEPIVLKMKNTAASRFGYRGTRISESYIIGTARTRETSPSRWFSVTDGYGEYGRQNVTRVKVWSESLTKYEIPSRTCRTILSVLRRFSRRAEVKTIDDIGNRVIRNTN